MRSLRFSIGGLMGAVLLAAIASAGLAHPSASWAGVIDLLTRGMLCLAVVGAICRTGAERAWWLGFASFGWAYLGLPFGYFGNGMRYPTHALLAMLGPMLGVPVEENALVLHDNVTPTFFRIGHCLWALLTAPIGGFLASALFGVGSARPEEMTDGAQPSEPFRPLWWVLPSAIVLSVLVLVTSIAVIFARLDLGIWACATYLLTWWLIGLTALGALCAKGRRREVWLGASFLGAGFMIVAFCLPVFEERDPEWVVPSVRVLRAVRPPFEALVAALSGDPNSVATKNARIRRMLKRPVPIQFEEKSLDGLLKYVKLATKESDGKAIPIFVDPIGLQEAEKTMNSMINPIDLEGIELQTTLGLCLKQLGLAFVVKDGLLEITSIESWDDLNTSPYDDPFQIVGHCLLALIAAGFGGMAAPLVCDLARGRRVRATRE